MDVREEVTTQFRQVAREHEIELAQLRDSLPLIDSGLDSLCYAIIVARLEIALGVDPFSASEDGVYPVTFGEFVSFYENAPR